MWSAIHFLSLTSSNNNYSFSNSSSSSYDPDLAAVWNTTAGIEISQFVVGIIMILCGFSEEKWVYYLGLYYYAFMQVVDFISIISSISKEKSDGLNSNSFEYVSVLLSAGGFIGTVFIIKVGDPYYVLVENDYVCYDC